MSTLHALLVDDNLENLDVLNQLLTMNGIECTAVHDPTQIVDQDFGDVNIVFLDLEMPKMDGYETFDYLRNQMGITAPIIAYTVHAGQINEAFQRGFQGFVGKPLQPKRFQDQLQRILAGEGVWEAQ